MTKFLRPRWYVSQIRRILTQTLRYLLELCVTVGGRFNFILIIGIVGVVASTILLALS